MNRFILVVVLLLGLAPSKTSATEPWADPKLSVHSGLQLWLDASRATGTQPMPVDNKLSAWMDASGKGRHLRQLIREAQPTRLPVGSVALVRFDGMDDHLRAVKQGMKLDAFSVFLVSVPRSNPGMFTGMLAFNAPGQRDYQSGLNIDFGSITTPRFNVLNVEGAGFGGYANLRTQEQPVWRTHLHGTGFGSKRQDHQSSDQWPK